jgi:hypothetical protein
VVTPAVIIFAPSRQSNSLGRALSVADLASAAGMDVELVAPDDGPIWAGASRYGVGAHTYSSSRQLTRRLEATYAGLAPIVWSVKPLAPSWRPALMAARTLNAPLVLDVDDHDAALSAEFRALSTTNRLKLHRFRPLHPTRIRQVLDEAGREADGLTVSSWALKDGVELGSWSQPSLRVPHPRDVGHPVRAPARAEHVRVGFFGTARAHKGTAAIRRLILRRHDVVLHAFAGGRPEGGWNLPLEQLREHQIDESMAQTYGAVDVVVLPQDTTPGAALQLPAKLVDALQHGVPVVSTPTPAVRELAGDTVFYVDDWTDDGAVDRQLDAALTERSEDRHRRLDAFEQTLSYAAQSDPLRQFFSRLATNTKHRAAT